MGAVPMGTEKEDLAAAGRKKLEAFRNRKRNKVKRDTAAKEKAKAKAKEPQQHPPDATRFLQHEPSPNAVAVEVGVPVPPPLEEKFAIPSTRETAAAAATTTLKEEEKQKQNQTIPESSSASSPSPATSKLSGSYAMLSDAYIALSDDLIARPAGAGVDCNGGGAGAGGSSSTRRMTAERNPLLASPSPRRIQTKKETGEEATEGAADVGCSNAGLDCTARSLGGWEPNSSAGAGVDCTGTDRSDGKRAGQVADGLGLERHIDQLTRDKFGLERDLAAKCEDLRRVEQERADLARRVAAERADLEELREQMDRLSAATERALDERDAAINGSEAARERSNALASEVIQLEETLLQLRSREIESQKHAKSIQNENENESRTRIPSASAFALEDADADAVGCDGDVLDRLEGRTSAHTTAMVKSVFALLNQLEKME